MIIKFIDHKRLPKTKHIGQVIEGDFKDLYQNIRAGWAVEATPDDLEAYKQLHINKNKAKPENKKPPCDDCIEKKKNCKGCQDK